MYDRLLLTIDDVVSSTTISKSEVYRMMKDGRLRWHRVAGRRRIRPDDLDLMLNIGPRVRRAA